MQLPLADQAARWAPSRDEALRRLAAFVPRAGRQYAAGRNEDRGPDDRTNVSTLSPYLRYRAISEPEVLTAVLQRHSASGAEKFVSEVFWRTYWKGWLESHPEAWSRYRSGLEQRLAERHDIAAAVGARTGIDAFDAWVTELVKTGYLHNHARMWFASIWIFTLGLPWELGADFFIRHLLDGDPASNTLSWRWVAGLHTRGKTYAAGRDNIRRYTGERFALTAPLARATPALSDPPIPRVSRPELPVAAPASLPTLLVIHEDDVWGDRAGVEQWSGDLGLRGVCALHAVGGRSPLPVSPAVTSFGDQLLRESATRLAGAAGAVDFGLLPTAQGELLADALAERAAQCGATRVVVPFAPVGPARDALAGALAALAARGVPYREVARQYDAVAWPACDGGFFKLRGRIPAILAQLGITAG